VIGALWRRWFRERPGPPGKDGEEATPPGPVGSPGRAHRPRPTAGRRPTLPLERAAGADASPGVSRAERVDGPEAGDPVERLRHLAEGDAGRGGALPEGLVPGLLERSLREGRLGPALYAARDLARARPELIGPWLPEAARRADELGQDALAAALLQPLLGSAAGGTGSGEARAAAATLAAERAERSGDLAAARRYWEWVVFEGLAAHPGALDRVRRLAARGAEGDSSRDGLAGETVLAQGARLGGGRFEIEREIGRGGAGIVFLARDRRLAGRRVALKVAHRTGPAERARIRREAQVAASLDHPGIVRVVDLDDALGALALEWLPARSLRQALAARRPARPEQLLRWLVSTLEALAVVHDQGLVHRDVKPSNLLLRPDGRVVLTDFGVSLPTGADARLPGEGTLAYMPPEQRSGRPAHPTADLYAFARSALELAGLVPEEAVGRRLEAVLEAALSRDAEERPSAEDLRRGLLAALPGTL